jgi:hypothetical protein
MDTVKRRVAFYFVSFFLFGFLFVADIVTAQTIAYRRANLASNLSNVANNVTPGLADPWGIAFLPGQPFFLADNNVGRVTAHANADFSLGATPSAATVTAGRSTQFMLNVVPSGRFANSFSFSCAPVTGVTCNFNPAVITPTNGTTKTVLTVTSSSVMHFGFLMPDLIGPWTILAAMALLSLAMWRTRSLPYPRRPQLAAVITAIVMLGLAISGCGRYASSSQVNRGTATINVGAQSGAISHTTTISVTVQ